MRLFKEKYNPSEPRINKGNKNGGRWTGNQAIFLDFEVNKLESEKLDDLQKQYLLHELQCSGFNNLNSSQIVGSHNRIYNCIGWAFGDDKRWWWPSYSDFWPEKCLVEDDDGYIDELASFNSLFETVDAEKTTNDKPEEGYVKLATYKVHKNITHMARLLPDGKWTSKMGGCAKIVNDNCKDLTDGTYGNIIEIIKIPTKKWATLKDLE